MVRASLGGKHQLCRAPKCWCPLNPHTTHKTHKHIPRYTYIHPQTQTHTIQHGLYSHMNWLHTAYLLGKCFGHSLTSITYSLLWGPVVWVTLSNRGNSVLCCESSQTCLLIETWPTSPTLDKRSLSSHRQQSGLVKSGSLSHPTPVHRKTRKWNHWTLGWGWSP